MKQYRIQARETGTRITEFTSYEEAVKELNKYYEEDKLDGNYTEDFYEIVEIEN